MLFRRLAWVLAVLLAITGCAPEDPLDTPAHAPLLRDKRPTEPIELKELRIDLRPGEAIGEYRWSLGLCRDTDDRLLWGSKVRGDADDGWPLLAERAFRDNGYRMSGDPDNLFASASLYSRDPTYQLGARVVDLRMDVCDHQGWLSGEQRNVQSGKAWMRVEWSVFSVLQRHVIFRKTLTGQGILESGRPEGLQRLIDYAFEDSARRLAADEEFYATVTQAPPRPDEVRTSWIPLHIRKWPLFETPLTTRSEIIRQSVVSVGSESSGHGSGFFVAPSLILTNAHVVRGNERVPVIFPSGRQVTGDVLRVHRPRDVALVRVEEAGYLPLPIRTRRVEPGEDVFAVGSPFMTRLKGTISRGSVSAYRQNSRGLRDIQADVDTHPGNSGGPLLDRHGNIVGLSYAGFADTPRRSSIGINLFIPIDDALRKLRVRLGLPDSELGEERGIVMP
jgi:hypothetical protein